MGGLLLSQYTFSKEYGGNIRASKASPRIGYASGLEQGTVEGGDANEFYYVDDERYIPYFVVWATDYERGGMYFAVWDTIQEQKETRVPFASANFLGLQGTTTYIPYYSYTDVTYTSCAVGTNYPIFASEEDATEWIESGYIKNDKILNYNPNILDELHNYYIYNKYSDAVASFNGLEFSGTTYERYEDFAVDGLACLYEPTPFEMSIHVNGSVIGSVFSNIGRGISEVVRENELYYTSPFYDVWDKIQVGSFRVSQNFLETNMLIFDSLDDVEAWLAGDEEVATKAKNYDDIVNSGETKSINNTGQKEDATEFGHSYHSSIFTKKYVMGRGRLQEIANNLYDNTTGGLIDDILTGLGMYGNNPIEAVVNLTYFPVDMRNLLQTSPQSYVYFGGYKMNLSGSVDKVIFEDGFVDMGTFALRPTFNSYLDFEPYTRLYIYLPYVGTYGLDIKRYLNHSINIRYYIDTTTGGCMACLIADGVLVDYFNGQMGVNQPIMATNFGDYANAQMNTLLGAGQSIAQNAVSGAMAGSAGGGVGMAIGAGVSAFGGIATDVAQAEYDLTNNNINNYQKTKGGSSGKINEFLPQYVYFIFELMDVKETQNLVNLHGKPSNASGTLDNFGGFLKCDNVKLECAGATDDEKNKILALLKSGIYI